MTDNPNKKTFWDKVHLDPTMLLILLALLVYSALVIWSASGQDIGMMERKIGQIAMGLVIMVVMAQIPPRVYEGWAPYLYIICIILLVAVDAFGAISKGAQRWLDLGIVRFQPSEIAKIAVPLMVARFINRDVCPPSLKNTGIALVLIFMPTLLVAAQPDLGTSILVALSGLFVLFLSGLSWRLIGVAVVLVAAFIPILWFFLMHDYQRQRVMMLLDPCFDRLLTRNSCKMRVGGSVSFQKPERILQICHSSGIVRLDESRPSENGLAIEGVLEVSLLYLTDDDAAPVGAISEVLPFSGTVEAEGIREDCVWQLNLGLEQLGAVMLGGGEAEVKAQLTVELLVFQPMQEEVVTSVQTQPFDLKRWEQQPGIVGYIVQPGDSLWKIAKKFHTTVDQVREMNEIDGEEAGAGARLLLIKEVTAGNCS